jgi:DNA-directed RNA polymerase subunit F|tara:strand:- start:67 stop:366 length:300 start_codon:yes stop_codon:yes gene_type:complete
MINKMKPLSLAEVNELIGDIDERKDLKDYIKRFGNLSKEDSVKLSEEVRGLDNMKVKEEHVVKIADFVPKTAEELNKIFTDVSLDEEECNKILEIVKDY